MEAPVATTMNLRFPVGSYICLATLSFEKGDDVMDILKKFFEAENIPEYLHTSIIHCVVETLHAQRFSQIRQSQDGKRKRSYLCEYRCND